MGLVSHLRIGVPDCTGDPGAGIQSPPVTTDGPMNPYGEYRLELNAVSLQVPVVPPVTEKLQYCGYCIYTRLFASGIQSVLLGTLL
jgi:hypothetical protein